MAAKNVKKRNWALVVYPESLPENWIDILTETGLPCAISPLHDKDVDPDGNPKKAHYHIILAYSGPTTFNSVKELSDRLNAPIPKPLDSIKGMYRYHTHTDNPEKAQYSDSDRRFLNGFNILEFAELTRAEVNKIKLDLVEIIVKSNIYEYSDLMDLLRDSGMYAEFDVASSHTLFFNGYISSRRNKLRSELAEAKTRLSKSGAEPVVSADVLASDDLPSDPGSGSVDPDSDPLSGAADLGFSNSDFLSSNSEEG